MVQQPRQGWMLPNEQIFQRAFAASAKDCTQQFEDKIISRKWKGEE
jgi:hypothetical protein